MQLKDFNKSSRTIILKHLEKTQFDLLVIGGGITGASIFCLASQSGLKTALVEARDFASGTSSLSSRLIHGGLRYIKTLNFKLTRQACKERNRHLRWNRRLVKPIPFLIPLYRRGKHSALGLKAALLLYDALSGFKNHKNHRFISRDEVMLQAPSLCTTNLAGGYVYYDAIVNDSRLTLETIKQGASKGGVAINYAGVTALSKTQCKICGVQITDHFTGSNYHIKGRCVINATGVSADSIRRMDEPACPLLLSLSRGTHLVFKPKDIPLNITLTFFSPVDGRVLFLIKHDDCFLYGTTDDWAAANPAFARPEPVDVDYLLDSLNMYMPQVKLNKNHIQYAYSGYRPLVCRPGQVLNPSAISRKDYLEASAGGLITVTGGKLTTARIMARKALKLALTKLDKTHKKNLVISPIRCLAGSYRELQQGLHYWIKKKPELSKCFINLFNKYGLAAHSLCNRLLVAYQKHASQLAYELQKIEINYSCSCEMVCTSSDLMQRRLDNLGWPPLARLGFLESHKKAMQHALGLNDIEYQKQFDEYKRYLQKYHSVDFEVDMQEKAEK